MSAYELVCVHDFHGYAKGTHIKDPAEINRILSEDKGHHFVKIAAVPTPTDEPKEEPVEKTVEEQSLRQV